ncbi:MAG TPA: hypothetical protein VIW47_08450, partial [Nitrospiraceae bacterium]
LRPVHAPSPSPSLFSRMLKKSAGFVLASLRGSRYRSVRIASSLTAALLDELIQHSARCFPIVPHVRTVEVLVGHNSFPDPV